MTDKNKVNEVDLKAKVEPVVTEEVDQVRFNNDGHKVKLSFGDFRLRELSVRAMSIALLEAFDAFQMFAQLSDEDDSNNTDMAIILRAMQSEEVWEQVGKIIALYCGTDDHKQFMDIKVPDLNKLIPVLKEVIRPEELKQLFLALNLAEFLNLPLSTEQ